MHIRYGSAKIIKTASTLGGLVGKWQGGLLKRASKQLASFDLDPEKYVYLRNRAVSALELHGPNQNFDAFEYSELADKYNTFIGQPISVDHIGSDQIGLVLDSEFIPSPSLRDELALPLMPYDQTLEVLGGMVRGNKDLFQKIFSVASSANLVRGSDEKMIVESVCKLLHNSGWVENVWAIEKALAEEHTHGLVDAILNGEVTDSSMGCMVNNAVCSVCHNVATGELPEHEDFCDCIRLYKGRPMQFGGITVIPHEINRDINFFEDSLILPFKFGGKAGGEGADAEAKLLEVFSSKKKKTASRRKAYIETNPNAVNIKTSPEAYVMVGDMPDNVRQNRDEFMAEQTERIQEHISDQSSPGTYPEGSIVLIKHEDQEVDAAVVEEREEGTLLVAIDGLDEPVEISHSDVIEVKEYPEEMSYEDADSSDGREMHPEKRAASV